MTTIGTRLCRAISRHTIAERDPGMNIGGEKVFAFVFCKCDSYELVVLWNSFYGDVNRAMMMCYEAYDDGSVKDVSYEVHLNPDTHISVR